MNDYREAAYALLRVMLCVSLLFCGTGKLDGSTGKVAAPEIEGRAFVASYRLDPSQSRFMVRAFSGGPLWFKGHDHFIAVRDFTGEAQLTPGAPSPASLQMTIRADSLVE